MPERRSPLDVPDSLDDPPGEGEGEAFGGAPGARGPEDYSLRGRATDFMRKALVAGVGALFLTEEGIRSLVGELKLPKELIGALLAQADRTKQEVVRILGDELRHFFESAQLREELLKLLTDVTIEVKTEIKLHPEGRGVRSEIVGEPHVGFRRPGRRKDK
ncbi:MAG: hypothetical protein ACYDCL_12585 [Myxococcales bacterium]